MKNTGLKAACLVGMLLGGAIVAGGSPVVGGLLIAVSAIVAILS